MSRFLSRLRALLGRVVDQDALRDELNDEIQAFLEHDIDSKIESGMTPAEARRAALNELGGADNVKERVWDTAAGARIESVVRDLRYAARSLSKARAFSLSVIGGLSLGLAAMIMALALVNAVFQPPIIAGVQNQERLVTLGIMGSFAPGRFSLRRTAWTDYPDVIRALDGMSSLEGVASVVEADIAVSLPEPTTVRAAFVSPDYFDLLGVRPEVGRSFAPEEGGVGSAVAVIGHDLWTQELGSDPSVIGRPISVGRQPFQVIGVAPPEFGGTAQASNTEIWVPVGFADLVAQNSRIGTYGFMPGELHEYQISYIGRIGDGVPISRVETELSVVAAGLVASATDPADPVRVEVSGLFDVEGDFILEAAMAMAVPFLVLAIGCINAANLMLVRATRRRREVAVRLALGASRLRLVRQLVTESLLLTLGAVIVAMPLAWWGMQWLESVLLSRIPLDANVVAGAFVIAFLTSLAFGLVPALQAAGQRPSAALGTGHAGSGGSRSQSRGRSALVAGQVALSLGLLGTAFQLTSALELMVEPPASDPDRVLLASFDLDLLRFSPVEREIFYDALLDAASRLPGVEAAALSNLSLSSGWNAGPGSPVVTVRDDPDVPFGPFTVSGFAGGDYFKVTGLELIRGREFAEADRREIPEVAIVTEALADELFEEDDAPILGRSVTINSFSPDGRDDAVFRIVGVVESPLEASGSEAPAIFFPSPIQERAALTLQLRSAGPAAPLGPVVRDLVARLDAQVPILELTTLDQYRAHERDEMLLARLVAGLGFVAVMLASIGLYGVTSYSVAIRTREIAVRMALGARRSRVQTMILRQAFSLVVIGSVVGGLAAIGISLMIRAELLDVAAVDLVQLGGAAAVLATAMLVASLLPARRAARMDPNAVLREE